MIKSFFTLRTLNYTASHFQGRAGPGSLQRYDVSSWNNLTVKIPKVDFYVARVETTGDYARVIESIHFAPRQDPVVQKSISVGGGLRGRRRLGNLLLRKETGSGCKKLTQR